MTNVTTPLHTQFMTQILLLNSGTEMVVRSEWGEDIRVVKFIDDVWSTQLHGSTHFTSPVGIYVPLNQSKIVRQKMV